MKNVYTLKFAGDCAMLEGDFCFHRRSWTKYLATVLKNQAKLDKLESFDIIFDHYYQTYYSGSQENYEPTSVGPNKVCIQV